jgi:hypothetical protein
MYTCTDTVTMYYNVLQRAGSLLAGGGEEDLVELGEDEAEEGRAGDEEDDAEDLRASYT